MTRAMRTIAAAGLLALAGCGPATADVAGKVTFQGKPVVYGTVVMIGADGLPKSCEIRPDGSYLVPGLPVGPAKVAVSSPAPPGSQPPKKPRPAQGRDGDDEERGAPPAGPPADPAVIKAWVALPEKYGDPAKSDLTVTVTGDGKPVDLDLK